MIQNLIQASRKMKVLINKCNNMDMIANQSACNLQNKGPMTNSHTTRTNYGTCISSPWSLYYLDTAIFSTKNTLQMRVPKVGIDNHIRWDCCDDLRFCCYNLGKDSSNVFLVLRFCCYNSGKDYGILHHLHL